MKKSSFVAMILGTLGGLLFALGMCMALLEEWNSFVPGVVMGIVGLVVLLIMIFVWRKMEHKAPLKLSKKTIGTILIGVIGTIIFGIGMTFVLSMKMMVAGIPVGIVGIIILLCLIPMIKGFK